MSDVKPGDKVLYSPHEDHALDLDRQGERCFRFAHAEGATAGDGPRAGDPVTGTHGRLKVGRDGRLRTRNGEGHPVRHAGPRSYWPATVVRVNADGTADLEIDHPVGCVTLYYPDRGNHPQAPGIAHDPAKGPHTFHLAGE